MGEPKKKPQPPSLKEENQTSQKARVVGAAKLDISKFKTPYQVLKRIPEKLCRKHKIAPLQQMGSVVLVAFSEPNPQLERDLAAIVRSKVQVAYVDGKEIEKFLDRHYKKGAGGFDSGGMGSGIDEELAGVSSGAEDEDDSVGVLIDGEDVEKGAVIKFVNAIFVEAIASKASDIHLEVYEKDFRIRFRTDGVLSEKIAPPRDAASAIISRIKILSRMNIAEKRRPQDGRLKVKFEDGKNVDLRVSCIPTLFGEKIVMRILDKSNLQVDLTKLGLEKDDLQKLRDTLYKPQGMILVTGPTGSGKTTTLYSALSERNSSDVNVSTVEDPVEFNIGGINQVQVNHVIEFGFASALRSFLRQDPDIIMVGEIRDFETGSIAYKAAATGHLVLSTLHTNDTASTVTRLLDMGIPSYIIGDSTSLIIAQRLMKTICVRCKVPDDVGKEALLELGVSKEEVHEFLGNIFKGKGCASCNKTGFSGRIAVFEVMNVVPEVKRAVINKKSIEEVKSVAIEKGGMRTLRGSALLHMKRGIVSVDEVLNITLGDEE